MSEASGSYIEVNRRLDDITIDVACTSGIQGLVQQRFSVTSVPIARDNPEQARVITLSDSTPDLFGECNFLRLDSALI